MQCSHQYVHSGMYVSVCTRRFHSLSALIITVLAALNHTQREMEKGEGRPTQQLKGGQEITLPLRGYVYPSKREDQFKPGGWRWRRFSGSFMLRSSATGLI